MFESFPFDKLEAFKFSLLSLPFIYQKITEEDCKKLLTSKGDFVVDLGDSDVLFLYLRTDDLLISLFKIKFCALHNPDRIGFSFGDKCFTTLPGLIAHFSKQSFRVNDAKMRLRCAIYRKSLNGSFGYGMVIKLNNGKQKAFIRSLCNNITANLSSCCGILENLLLLKHENICQIRDYDVCERGEGLPAVILVQYDCYHQNLHEYLAPIDSPLPSHQYIYWMNQIVSALTYLRENDVECKRLSLRSCLLDKREKVKITDFWLGSDMANNYWWMPKKFSSKNGISEEVFTRSDYWRNIAPEVLLGHSWTEQSFVWTFALFFQQLLFHGKSVNRDKYSSLVDFFNAGCKDDAITFPKGMTSSSLTNFMETCFEFDSDQRPTFMEMVNAINLQYNRCKIVNFFNHF